MSPIVSCHSDEFVGISRSLSLRLGETVAKLPIATVVAVCIALASPAISQENAGQPAFADIQIGKLSGKLVVQWISPDLFLFLPDATTPLKFTRKSGQSIAPGKMLTDGGSIPRPIWILRNYSPWGFAPAFIMHDWLFAMKKCRYPGFEKYTLEEAGLVMTEVMKTMIESKTVDAGPVTVGAMYLAVVSSPARQEWEHGKCSPPPTGMFPGKPIFEYTLSF
jgi:Protein of unknown function (DUF1353)